MPTTHIRVANADTAFMPHTTRQAIARWTVTALLIVVALAIGVVTYTFSAQERGSEGFRYARPAKAPYSDGH